MADTTLTTPEVAEPKIKKPRILSEKQRENLAKGRALKLEMNQANKRAKVEKTSEEEKGNEGVEETKENGPPPTPKLKRQKAQCKPPQPVEREVQDDDLVLSDDDTEEDQYSSAEDYPDTNFPLQTTRSKIARKPYGVSVSRANVRESRQPFFL